MELRSILEREPSIFYLTFPIKFQIEFLIKFPICIWNRKWEGRDLIEEYEVQMR